MDTAYPDVERERVESSGLTGFKKDPITPPADSSIVHDEPTEEVEVELAELTVIGGEIQFVEEIPSIQRGGRASSPYGQIAQTLRDNAGRAALVFHLEDNKKAQVKAQTFRRWLATHDNLSDWEVAVRGTDVYAVYEGD